MPQLGGILSKKKAWKLQEIVQALRNAYCDKIGVEYMHMADPDQKKYIRELFELRQYTDIPNAEKVHLLNRVYEADEFANFCANKFNTAKRFGIEGVQAFIPGMKALVDTLQQEGCEKVIVGMPHRGRLNFLANVIRKPLETIFAEFQGYLPES